MYNSGSEITFDNVITTTRYLEDIYLIVKLSTIFTA